MLIVGIRKKIACELDTRRSSVVMRYLIHFLQMFAYLGVIIPVLIVVDYYSIPETKKEKVNNKYYQIMDSHNHIEYHFKTDSYHYNINTEFYENIAIMDPLTFYLTPIFKTVIKITYSNERHEYVHKPFNIYKWPLIVIGLTFICSIILIIRLFGWIKKRDRINYDSEINLGVFNALLCLFVIVFLFFNHVID